MRDAKQNTSVTTVSSIESTELVGIGRETMTTETLKAAQPRYLTVAETAKVVRATLKKRYPAIKMSVRSKSYAGGASIHISWSDGPRAREVEAITEGFEGRSFDGMNDLASPQHSWLLPDGTAETAYRPESHGGSVPGYVSDAPHPDAELVHFGANYVFGNRHISMFDFREQRALECIRKQCKCDGDPPNDRFANDWVSNLARQMVHNFEEGESTQATFERVILNR